LILFATWLPIAPQLAPIVSDLFELSSFPSPFDCLMGIIGGSGGGNDGNDGGDVTMKGVDGNEHTAGSSDTVSGNVEHQQYRFIVAEAAHNLCEYYGERAEHATMRGWWNWSGLFGLLHSMSCQADANNEDDAMVWENAKESNGAMCWSGLEYNTDKATKWHAARAIGHLLGLRPSASALYVERLGVQDEMVPWKLHPWVLEEEEERAQSRQFAGIAVIVLGGNVHEIALPTLEQIRQCVSLHPSLVHVGRGVLLPKRHTIAPSRLPLASRNLFRDPPRRRKNTLDSDDPNRHPQQKRQNLILTSTTSRNMSLLGAALCTDPYPPPILICGPAGAGKSSLVRELAHFCSSVSRHGDNNGVDEPLSHLDELLELHIDEETDSKTLLGCYAATDIPGEFAWRAGALTTAARTGKWVLLEDVDSCPLEIQAALVRLLKERILPLGGGRDERCHPNFRLFGTCTTDFSSVSNGSPAGRRSRLAVKGAGAGGRRIMHPKYWRKVDVDPIPFSELQYISRELYPTLPPSILESALQILRLLDRSGRTEGGLESSDVDDDVQDDDEDMNVADTPESMPRFLGGRPSSVRDYMKLLSRIADNIKFEPNIQFATESQRTLCLAETVDVFAAAIPFEAQRREFVSRIAAPTWSVSVDLAVRYVETRRPTMDISDPYVKLGRATIPNAPSIPSMIGKVQRHSKEFAETYHALRLMEAVGVCVVQNESTLLVGETGCGKTSLVQRLASATGRELVVQNLSLQTDSTDLLGGYRPLEIRHLARKVYLDFVDIFVSSFSRTQNSDFLAYVSAAFEKGQWKRLAQCFRRAAKMGQNKVRELAQGNGNSQSYDDNTLAAPSSWSAFSASAERFERQRLASESGLAFAFTEGALVDAIRTGKWVLLDEINLASSETLERLCGLMDDSRGSLTLTERGDTEALRRHPDFRLFAAMNPATDTGKKDLPASIRARFSEIYVDELLDPVELRTVAARYLAGALTGISGPLEQSDNVTDAVNVYLDCRSLSDQALVDGGGQKPRYTLRTLCRALAACRSFIVEQHLSPTRAILEGFELAFEGPLDLPSRRLLRKTLHGTLSKGVTKKELDHPGRRPGGRGSEDGGYVLMKPFWIKTGTKGCVDWAEESQTQGRSRFVLTTSAQGHLRCLSRAVAAGPWPILLEGPTSAGKTTLVEYLAAKCGHKCVRINNHEHTDVQEYTGCYATDSSGKLVFQEGILVQALRMGYWVILDELNLAPSEVLEALNRLLDDNRELYLPEINETVSPHSDFRLFATQNPSGVYGGRKPLSRAFRNRFVEIHVSDIPSNEMASILELRCGCPPTHAKLLVKVMSALRQRRSQSGVFRGKDGLITPRDLLRWAERGGATKAAIAVEGYMLLAERLRSEEEKEIVRSVIEEQLKVTINCESTYYAAGSKARQQLEMIASSSKSVHDGLSLQSIAPTRSILRLLTLVNRCVEQREPVLLVGETGCGKTTVVQLLGMLLKRHLHVVNCHANTETSDLLGGLRPVRRREEIVQEMVSLIQEIIESWPDQDEIEGMDIPSFLVHKSAKATPYPADAPSIILSLVHEFATINATHQTAYADVNDAHSELSSGSASDRKSSKKRRKLEEGGHLFVRDTVDLGAMVSKVKNLYQRYCSLFEWVDGPLVTSMRRGDLLLLDEMSLAEDAVLERLNSVLEPSRMLILAEKGGDDDSSSGSDTGSTSSGYEVRAHEDFRIFATMNPGGDFGKRELSPALRSRFTEIWVPAVTDRVDVDLVLERSLSAAVEQIARAHHPLVQQMDTVREKMLDYVDFFNEKVCGDPTSPFADFTLSLRDVLAWAHFVVDVCSKQSSDASVWLAYAHGASLMHLDGLGLGTGISQDDASSVRIRAKEFILRQVPAEKQSYANVGFMDELEGTSYLDQDSQSFGVHPFAIPIGPQALPYDLNFNLSAPTTGSNLRRVLRAMQISKPILLEGSPGVGKTSLISAFAAASGHRLVRINLSEQTDISDLLGSDLPMHDDPSTSVSGRSGGQGSFKWCDGVLLQAIKRGDWVLLDELNLASQSVLEGLNSCLDHRANVFIPELGLKFACPSTFRIFAAQNPLAQGGGRKGLPKSFLNRFTKVCVDALTPDDLRSIVASRFPTLPSSLVDRMVAFNNSIQVDVVEKGEYGQMGSPWEFNLRDVFRWCQLLVAATSSSSSGDRLVDVMSAGEFVDTIYVQRLRSQNDRDMITSRFKDCFDAPLAAQLFPSFDISNTSVRVGSALLKRNPYMPRCTLGLPLQGAEPGVVRTLMRPTQAVAHCVNMNWPTLIVGSESSGKSTILKFLSESCNVHLEEIALTQSSDVNELVGCFEQVDASEYSIHLLRILRGLCEVSCQILSSSGQENEILRRICSLQWKFDRALDKVQQDSTCFSLVNEKDAWSTAQELTVAFEYAASICTEFDQLCKVDVASARDHVDTMTKLSGNGSSGGSNMFRWTDGVLVKAMQEGYWLHFKNVNYCPSSVLDRLNPLMESGGELVLTECGASSNGEVGDGAACRVVKSHPNFRLFLSMDPGAAGEVSRAMRNRCVEIYVLSSDMHDVVLANHSTTEMDDDEEITTMADAGAKMAANEVIDMLELLCKCGLRSQTAATTIFRAHERELISCIGHGVTDKPTVHSLKELGAVASGLLKRGLAFTSSLELSQMLAYELHHGVTLAKIGTYGYGYSTHDFLTKVGGVRSLLAFNPRYFKLVSAVWLSKPLAVAAETKNCPPVLDILLGLESKSELTSQYRKYSVSSSANLSDAILQMMLDDHLASFISSGDIDSRRGFFVGYSTKASAKAEVAASVLNSGIKLFSLADDGNGCLLNEREEGDRSAVVSYMRLSRVDRLAQLVREKITYDGLALVGAENVPSGDCTVIDVSYGLYEGRVDSSAVSCPVTPVLYPFFLAADDFVESWERSLLESGVSGISVSTNRIVARMLSARDRMWVSLSKSPYHRQSSLHSTLLGFDEAGFIVQWTWFKKALRGFYQECLERLDLASTGDLKQCRRHFELLLGSIDQALFDNAGDITSISESLWKKGGHPLVPAGSREWTSVNKLRRAADSCSFLVDDRVGFVAQLSASVDVINLEQLVKDDHPFLFMEESFRYDLLGSLSMASWATTDEMSGMKKDAGQTGYDAAEATKILSKRMDEARLVFIAKMKAATIDPKINTVENNLDVDEINRLSSSNANPTSCDASGDVMEKLISRFASAQVMQVFDIWCTREEAYLIGAIVGVAAAAVFEGEGQSSSAAVVMLRRLVPRMKNYINITLSMTAWSANDLRPYQTLIWSSECSNLSNQQLDHLIKCILPLMMATSSRHIWCNSFNNLDVITPDLLCPSSFWDRHHDSYNTGQHADGSSGSIDVSVFGAVRLDQHARNSALFRIVGYPLDGRMWRPIPHLTLENYSARVNQARLLIASLAKLPSDLMGDGDGDGDGSISSAMKQVCFLFSSVISALRNSFDDDDTVEELRALIMAARKDDHDTASTSSTTMGTILKSCRNASFRRLLEKIAFPLIDIIQGLRRGEVSQSKEQIALAWVYLGLLRLHLLVPTSPLDPGRKPAAKISQLDLYLDSLSSKLTVSRLDSGLATGDFAPSSPRSLSMLREAEIASKKRENQSKKEVERPPDAPPFFQLFQESRHFAKTTASIDRVIALIQLIRTDSEKGKSSETNWQSNSFAFTARILSFFSAFEDVTVPLVASTNMVQYGLRQLVHCNCKNQDKVLVERRLVGLSNKLLRYPVGDIFDTLIQSGDIDLIGRATTDSPGGTAGWKRVAVKTQLSVLLSSLARTAATAVQYRARYGSIDAGSREFANDAFISIVNSWQMIDSNVSEADQEPKGDKHMYGATEADEDKTERLFREQFPDHAEEFDAIIEAVDYADDGDDNAYHDSLETEDQSDTLKLGSVTLTDSQISLLCNVHRELYSAANHSIDDASRFRSFVLSYEAANRLGHAVDKAEKQRPDSWSTGAHLMALATRRLTTGRGHASLLNTDSSVADFHNDPNPLEIVKASECLERLTLRIAQLLRAFPGNSILIAIGRVVEQIRRLDLDITSVGKTLYGLEVILRKANEWEQHASERVKMGEPLQDISRLVAQWRRLELQSWSTLLDLRDDQCRKRAQRHFMRLILLVRDSCSEVEPVTSSGLDSSPDWIWKGQKKDSIRILAASSITCCSDSTLVELTKTLDSFFLTAGIGEFDERIRLLESFAGQLMSECSAFSGGGQHLGQHVAPSHRVALGRVLKSLWKYYSQLLPIIDEAKQSLRDPIEKRLKDEVKLSKWDEQSYYSLSESTEKSHRKLMKFLREYDEVLETDARSILEKDFVRGIRPGTDVGTTTAEPVTCMPSSQAMFPLAQMTQDNVGDILSVSRNCRSFSFLRLSEKKWVSEEFPISQATEVVRFVPGIKRYFKKMHNLFFTPKAARKIPSSPPAATVGSETAGSLCASLFERIESLRGDKTTRPMKQRALVDLFKTLKKNGYSSMKWSVPSQLREMIYVLQLPVPPQHMVPLKSDAVVLQGAESYFYRSVVELSLLQLEVNMMGSHYMSQREMALMLGFSEHGMLMIAQMRCMIQNVVHNLSAVDRLLDGFNQGGHDLPLGQDILAKKTQTFDGAFLSALENVKQLHLLMKSVLPLTEREKSSSARDLLSNIESCITRLDHSYRPTHHDSGGNIFVSLERLGSVETAIGELQDTLGELKSLSKQCKKSQSVPGDLFDPCLEQIEIALEAAVDVRQTKSNTASVVEESSSSSSGFDVKDLLADLDKTIERSLLGAQILCPQERTTYSDNAPEEQSVDSNPPLWDSHSSMLKEWNDLNIGQFRDSLSGLTEKIAVLYSTTSDSINVSVEERSQCFDITTEACSLLLRVVDAAWDRLSDALSFYRNAAKFEYVLLRLFRTLVAKGYCSDEVEEGGDGSGEGDASNMTFEDDVDGTGMGEGEGKNDVTDQLESEEQLMGLKNDEVKGEEQRTEQKALSEEEANQGMEMEADFDGEMFDVPEEPENDQNVNSEDEEELEREMGEGNDPNENVVDEKIWDNDEDSLGDNNDPEKFEKDNRMAGEAIEDEMRTKEDEEQDAQAGKDDGNNEDSNSPHQPEAKDANQKDDSLDAADDHNEDAMNEDLEDNYEEKNQGIEVREEENKDDDNALDLGDERNLDNEGGTDNDDGSNGGEEGLDCDAGGDANLEEDAGSGGEDALDPDALEAPDDDVNIDDNEEQESEALQSATHGGEAMEEGDDDYEEGDPAADQDEMDTDLNPSAVEKPPEKDAHGVAAMRGADTAAGSDEEDDENKDKADDANLDADEDEADAERGGASGNTTKESRNEGVDEEDGGGELADGAEGDDEDYKPTSRSAPNPFRDPGDAEKFWHEKLNMIESGDEGDQSAMANESNDADVDAMDEGPPNPNQQFEYDPANQSGTTQVLGLAKEEEAIEIDPEKHDNNDKDETEEQGGSAQNQPDPKQEKKDKKQRKTDEIKQSKGANGLEKPFADAQQDANDDATENEAMDETAVDSDINASMSGGDEDEDEGTAVENKVVTDLSQLKVAGSDAPHSSQQHQDADLQQFDEVLGVNNSGEMADARRKWSQIQAETNSLSRRLCEKLRLVMEPLVASKLRGDYRTGKRINMKRVIGYIASGYRKDKIWLRRTKPEKRDYRILLAVDDSESMKKSGAGDMALAALSTLANGMSQLEVGELGIASFGEDMNLLHPFHKPFTSESGVGLMNNFKFEDKRTRTALCVEAAIDALDDSQAGTTSSLQLVFLISDGRIERDSRSKLRKLVREMTEKNILLVMIIVEGAKSEGKKKKDSIVQMKEVSFENGKPKMKHFIDDYPFPYYMVLEDMTFLPEILGDALRQWFEILTQIQSQGIR